ncbi:hypothetical protein [Paenibacillus sp. YYML68]|uniref:hypothetical protein n=1 Tax=Paenibacillus sp. YYML68 TaxID=2909250 RepID=UPI002491E246|nr:hypothetical protein [Paenibacillus sp. YYML68]
MIKSISTFKDFDFNGLTQIEGRSTGAELKQLANEAQIFVTKITTSDFERAGLFWVLEETQ